MKVFRQTGALFSETYPLPRCHHSESIARLVTDTNKELNILVEGVPDPTHTEESDSDATSSYNSEL